MSKLKFTISSRKNEGLIMSPSELLEQYFFGVRIQNRDGTEINQEVIKTYILSAQEEIEKYLNIKLLRKIILEDKSFYREDFRQWNYIKTTYPVEKAFTLRGFINDQLQIEYPPEWLSIKRSNNGQFYRHITIVPNQGAESAFTSGVVFSGITPQLGLLSFHQIPNYWEVRYCTGFEKVPSDLFNFIGKLAAINLFHIAGDLILGAGIASQSIGVDGLSQSISTTSSATNAGYGSRIIGYLNDLKISLPRITNFYRSFTMTSV